MGEYKRIEYMCRICGKRESRIINSGRPLPGTCSRRSNNGPHTWVVNRKY